MYKLADHIACAVAGITGDHLPSLSLPLLLQALHKRSMVLQGSLDRTCGTPSFLHMSEESGACAQRMPTSS